MSAKRLNKLKVLLIISIILFVAVFAYTVPFIPVIIQESYQEEVSYEELEAYSVMVPYDVTVSYTIQVPYTVTESYTVQIPYDIEVKVIKTDTILSRTNRVCEQNHIYGFDFYIDTPKKLSLVWSSDKQVLAFLIIEKDLVALVETAILIYMSAFAPEIAIPIALEQFEDNFRYYNVQSIGDSSLVTLNEGNFCLRMIIVNAPVTLNTKLSYDYETVETQTEYREETRYDTKIEYRDEIEYRTEIEYREEIRYITVSKIRLETFTRDVIIKVTLLEYLSGGHWRK